MWGLPGATGALETCAKIPYHNGKKRKLQYVQIRVVNGPQFEARIRPEPKSQAGTRPEPEIYFWSPI